MNKEIFKLIAAFLALGAPIITKNTGYEFGEGELQNWAETISTIVGLIFLYATRSDSVNASAKAVVTKKPTTLPMLILALVISVPVVATFTGCATITAWSKTPMGKLAIKAIPALVLETNPVLAPYVAVLGGIMSTMEAPEAPEQLSAELISRLEREVDLSPQGKAILGTMTEDISGLLESFFMEQQGKLLDKDKDKIIQEIGKSLEVIGGAYSTSSQAGSAVSVERKVNLSAGYIVIE